MIKNVLTHIGGVGMYGVISILIFITVFVAVGIWMLCLRRNYCESMQMLPLDGEGEGRPDSESKRKVRDPQV
jgi:hypothetical protein